MDAIIVKIAKIAQGALNVNIANNVQSVMDVRTHQIWMNVIIVKTVRSAKIVVRAMAVITVIIV